MRIVVIDTDDVGEAVSVLAALRNGTTQRRVLAAAPVVVDAAAEEVALSPVLLETWQWMVNNDTDDGVTPADVAGALHIPSARASWRLKELARRGLVYRLRHGYYRAGEG